MASADDLSLAAFNGLPGCDLLYCAIEEGVIFIGKDGKFIHMDLETNQQKKFLNNINARNKASILERWLMEQQNQQHQLSVRNQFLTGRTKKNDKKMLFCLVAKMANLKMRKLLIARYSLDLKKKILEFLDEQMTITCDHQIDYIDLFPISANETVEEKYFAVARNNNNNSNLTTISTLTIHFFGTDSIQQFSWKMEGTHSFVSNGWWIPIHYQEEGNEMTLFNFNKVSEIIVLSMTDGKETLLMAANDDTNLPAYNCDTWTVTPISTTRRNWNAVLFQYDIEQRSELWTFNVEMFRWILITSFAAAHSVGGDYWSAQINPNGTAFVHGDCLNAECKIGAHVYQFNFSEIKMPPVPRNAEAVRRRICTRTNIRELLEKVRQKTAVLLPEPPKRLEAIGEGCSGKVYKYILADGSIIAGKKAKIRTFNQTYDEREQMGDILKDILTEVCIIRQLEPHDRIIKFERCYWNDTQFFLFTEFMENGSVKNLFIENDLTEKEIIRLLSQAAEGLHFLHSQRPEPIIHRDIKSDNLLLDKNWNVKLADFGLAMHVAYNTLSFSTQGAADRDYGFGGTLEFMAPEILGQRAFGDRKAYGRRSDVWSLACTAVEMLIKKPPYRDERKVMRGTDVEFCRRATKEFQYPGNLVPNASPAMTELLRKMFVKNKHRRKLIPEVIEWLKEFPAQDEDQWTKL